MSVKDSLSLALMPAVTWFAIATFGLHWVDAVGLGFLASYAPLIPSALSKVVKAAKEGWNNPKPKNKK